MYFISPIKVFKDFSLTSSSQWLIKETDPSSGNTSFMLMPVSSTSKEN